MENKYNYFNNKPIPEIYGVNCFNDSVMKERLPKSIYKEIQNVKRGDLEMTHETAEVVANAMKDWAIERGATHFTHWFQPLTGLTAEKHDSFISPTDDGRVIMEFSGKELIKGEPDASSFPSGGIRATFEARGYTVWDVSSPAFLKEDKTGVTLYIPTAFISYTGEALDKKVPLLRSMEAINKQALRILKVMGRNSKRVTATVGPEQEYFLIDEEYFNKRPDLILSGRTLFGAMPPKGQEMEDHYFGTIKERVADFMRELNLELWKLGISAKTQHNEVAPNQFEIAPIFSMCSVATDTNQLVMETLRKIAGRHKLVCLLHEKPFAGVNGSGKHNNWSMSTDDGINLLEPGSNPQENASFLVFISAVIKAVDTYAGLLRMSAANAGNDHRLGANEAPPAIISIFLGDPLQEIFENISRGEKGGNKEGDFIKVGQTSLPKLPRDLTDRNRTSPFAFTGNKFEFRMVPSSDTISGPNVVLNTVVAEALCQFAEILEKSNNVIDSINKIVIDTYNTHKRIIFNGNNYSEEWVAEAAKRGLPNIKTTVDALQEMVKESAVELFAKHKILSKVELESRFHIYLEKYSKQINIEAGTMIEMANLLIFPAANRFARELADSVNSIKAAVKDADTSVQEGLIREILSNIKGLKTKSDELAAELKKAKSLEDIVQHAKAFREKVFVKMAELRVYGDILEKLVDKKAWPFPTYEELLFKL